MLLLLLEEDAAARERSRVRQLYRNTLMTDFTRAFKCAPNILDNVQRDRSIGYAIPEHKVTWLYLMRMKEFILQMCLHLPLFPLTLFRHKPLKQAYIFLRLKVFFPLKCNVSSLVSDTVLANAYKNRVMET